MSTLKDSDRIELFLDCVAAYQAEAEFFPVTHELQLLGPRNPQALANRRARIALLRKFTAVHDNVYLPTVAASLSALVPTTDSFVDDVTELLKSEMRGHGVFMSLDGTKIYADSVVRDSLYGERLHGDLEKNRRHQTRDATTLALSDWSWLEGVERLVVGFAKDIRGLIDEGSLDLESASSVMSSSREHEDE